MPLHPGPYLDLSIENCNTAVLMNTFGTLDANDRATATINVPALPISARGANVYHAYVLIHKTTGLWVLGSNIFRLHLQ